MSLFNLYAFILGLFWGSFLGVVADRAEKPKEILFSRSKCDYCGKMLRFFELIPLISFFIQRGRCRNCNRRLSLKYPFIELASGLFTLFLFSFSPFSELSLLILDWLFFSLLLVIAFADFFRKEFASWLVYLLLGIAFMSVLLKMIFAEEILSNFTNLPIFYPFDNLELSFLGLIFSHFLGLIFGLLLPLSIFLVTRKKGMGDGDIWLGAILGLFFGWQRVLILFFLAFIVGGLVAALLILLKKVDRRSRVAFVPFLTLAAFLVYFLR